MEKLTNCPECGDKLKIESTVRLLGIDKIKIVGYHQFCVDMDCHFEQDLKGFKAEKQTSHSVTV